MQYIGETTISLNERINIKRKGKKGCEEMIAHFKGLCKGYTFSIQVIFHFEGSGYNQAGEVDANLRSQRLEHEDYWIKCMRTIYPYGLNDKAKELSLNRNSVGHLFPHIPRETRHNSRTRKRRTNNPLTHEDFFYDVYMWFYDRPKESFNLTRKLLNKCKKVVLKRIASSIINGDDPCLHDENLNTFHEYILDIIDTKLYKKSVEKKIKKAPENLCVVYFRSKAIEYINLPSILRNREVIEELPEELRLPETIPVVTYKLGKTIRNKIFNFKDIVSSSMLELDNLNIIDDIECDCQSSPYCDPDHGHVITGNLNIVQNNSLKKLLSKGPNFREKKTINFSKAKSDIVSALDDLIERLKDKYNYSQHDFQSWKKKVIENLDLKVNKLKETVTVKRTSPVLSDVNALKHLDHLQQKYVITPIDKASNNFAFICKKFYLKKLLNEVDFLNGNSPTYTKNASSAEVCIEENVEFCSQLGYKINENEKCLPIMYWIPKMHKSPIGSRFIVASKVCSTKQLSASISKVFKLIFNQVRNFFDKSKFYSSYNRFWVVDNSMPLLSKIAKCN